MKLLTLNGRTIELSGAWILPNYSAMRSALADLSRSELQKGAWKIDGSAIDDLDTNGALLITTIARRFESAGATITLENFAQQQSDLLDYIKTVEIDLDELDREAGEVKQEPFVIRLGRGTVNSFDERINFLAFFGRVSLAMGRSIIRPWNIRWTPFWSNLQTAGVMALPIIGLLNFLIGLVITYQGGTLLQMFGMNIFAVHLVTISTLRVLGPLLTAIIIAGRTGSAYAAQIGTMVVNEEVDALRTFGIDPVDQLVIPKVFALIIALPFLTLFADIMAIFGGMVYANIYLDITFAEFIEQIPKVVTLNSLFVSLIQAPVFAIIIVLVGCYQGFQVKGGADSVGTQTTTAVVQAIFLVIIFEAIFSIATRSIPL